MKKFLIILGSIFLAIVVLAAIGIAFVAVRGNALDKESKAYADTAIPAIINGWSEKELLDRASPEFKQAVTQEQLDQIFHWFGSLGQFQKVRPATGTGSHVRHSADRQSHFCTVRDEGHIRERRGHGHTRPD